MDIYETIYMITATSQLLGQAYIDMITVIFAIMLVGYFVGPNLNKTMIFSIAGISALFVLPMLVNVVQTLFRIDALANSLTPEQVEALPYLTRFMIPESMQFFEGFPLIVVPLGLGYVAAIAFLVHCWRDGSVTMAANS